MESGVIPMAKTPPVKLRFRWLRCVSLMMVSMVIMVMARRMFCILVSLERILPLGVMRIGQLGIEMLSRRVLRALAISSLLDFRFRFWG